MWLSGSCPWRGATPLAMVNEIKTVGLLRGARGERPADISAIASYIVNLSCLVSDFPEIQELDVNPLMVMEKGAMALDARIIFKQPEGQEVESQCGMRSAECGVKNGVESEPLVNIPSFTRISDKLVKTLSAGRAIP